MCLVLSPLLEPAHLSVSSSGSKPLQHGLPESAMVWLVPFSILKRIEASATKIDHGTQRGQMLNLSVSSSGSKPLQRSVTGWLRGRPISFSILKRIEASATLLYVVFAASPRRTFSILKRIEASATGEQTRASDQEGSFQYPQADRSLCNMLVCPCPRAGPEAFSILKRIEASATDSSSGDFVSIITFQYPQADRSLCNWNKSFSRGQRCSSFQYPQADRSLCN